MIKETETGGSSSPQFTRRIRLQTLARLRWLAATGQLATIFFVHFWLKFDVPIWQAVSLVAALALINVILLIRFPRTHRLSTNATLALLAFDLAQLAALLYITGGLTNPFTPLLCVPVIISSASLPRRHTIGLGAGLIFFISLLAFSPYPLPWFPGETFTMPTILLVATWLAILLMTAFTAFYAFRVSVEAQQLSDALAATELVLQRETHLTQLDGLAAAAAHELGTPLATISVVAKEMERELAGDSRFAEDIQLLRSQSERCRNILKSISSLSAGAEEHLQLLAFSSLIEEVVAPHREFGIKLDVRELSPREDEPKGKRNPGIIYGLGNLIENAVDYARSSVIITTEYNMLHLRVTVEDDGPGYAPDILQSIGEPYVTSRTQYERAGGLGLGLFIAKTLLERSGATLTFENGGTGARVIVEWPRYRMEQQ